MSAQQEDVQYPVKLFVYDLSHGMARQMSMSLTGRQIDGIWHTSIVAWDREYFFGQGISSVYPGTSHHGAPIETIDLGTTSIDRDTFEGALLPDLRQRFRAQDYDLLSWNCNNFTQEVSEMLTGRDIPNHIRSLPQDFLSTPFGQMLRPQIDAMFRGPAATAPALSTGIPTNNNDLLTQVASRAYLDNTSVGKSQGQNGSTEAVRSISSQKELQELRELFPCVAVLFTSETCPPCHVIKPIFHQMAQQYYVDEMRQGNHKRIAFAQVDSGMESNHLFQALQVTATPTVKCFTLGEESDQVQGADVHKLKNSINLMLSVVYPHHPHGANEPRSVAKIPSQPHTFVAALNYRSVLQKFDSLVAQHPAKSFAEKADLQVARRIVASELIPWLETAKEGGPSKIPPSDLCANLSKAADHFEKLLPVTSLFPVLDLLRVAVLNEGFVKQLPFIDCTDRAQAYQSNPVCRLLALVSNFAYKGQWESSRRAVYLTTAKLLANLTVSKTFNDMLESRENLGSLALELTTTLLLCPDAGVRSAAAACAFNLAWQQHQQRSAWVNKDPQSPPMLGSRLGETWESELTSALLQAITNETESDETLHRLLAAFLLHIHLSQFWSDSIGPMLEVLEAKEAFQAKLRQEVVFQSTESSDLRLLLNDLILLLDAQ